ncbi:MAG: DegV family protein [Lachnospiraceae bacterium]|nr:DegV family protein [Candidatus Colinaster scatohippi]
MGVQIVIDSTTNINEEIRDDLMIIPLTIQFGEEEYIDGVTINNTEFYQKLIECDTLPKTSQATPIVFDEVFKEITDAGDTAVIILLSSKLSGTCQSAMIAAENYEGSIYVVDSMNATVGAGVLAEYAVRLRNSGMDAKTIAETLESRKGDIRLVALLDTLEYLAKGGRISSAAAFAGGLLSIKPVVCVEGGEVQVLGKARGSKQGNNYLVQEIQKAGGVDFDMPLLLGYSGLSDHLLKKYIEDSKALWEESSGELPTTVVGSVIGTHVGPGAIAVSFFAKNK